MRRATWVILALLAGGPACECQEGFTETRANPRVSTEVLDFGFVDVTQRTSRTFSITNGGDRDYDELTITVRAGTDPAFTLGSLPGRVRPAETVNIEVFVEPEVPNEIAGFIDINGRVVDPTGIDPHFVEFAVELHAVARNNGLPDIELCADSVDFGRIGAGDVAFGEVCIKNVGVRDLRLDEILLEQADDGPFTCRNNCSFSQAAVLRPLEQITVGLACSPPYVENYQGTLRVHSNDPDEREVTVQLSCAGQVVPQCVLDLLDDVSQLQPQTTVRLDASRSTTAVQDAYLKSYEWSLSYRPPGSTTVLESQGSGRPEGVELAVSCPDPATIPPNAPCSTRVDTLADVAGTYEVTLVVVDNNDVRSAPCTQRYRAVPEEALHIQLVWDHPTADLDLHYMRGEGPPFNHVTDCYFSNRFPAWWGTDNSDPRNPRLDVDDQGGFGPENVNVRAPEPGIYTIGVHYWNAKTEGDPATQATLRIFVRGQLAFTGFYFFRNDQEFWDVAQIDWPADPEAPVPITPIDSVINYPRPF